MYNFFPFNYVGISVIYIVISKVVVDMAFVHLKKKQKKHQKKKKKLEYMILVK